MYKSREARKAKISDIKSFPASKLGKIFGTPSKVRSLDIGHFPIQTLVMTEFYAEDDGSAVTRHVPSLFAITEL